MVDETQVNTAHRAAAQAKGVKLPVLEVRRRALALRAMAQLGDAIDSLALESASPS